MTSIARACDMIGVARSTLLYYERIGIVSPDRDPENGYRIFSLEDIHALIMIRQLQKAGFSLKEADAVMKGQIDPDLILARYQTLEANIQNLQVALEVVKSLVIHATGKQPETVSPVNPSGRWHAALEKKAGDAHAKWLERLGFDEKEQLYIRWVTRNLTDSEGYMKDFFLVFEQMKRQGPGSRSTTIRGVNALPGRENITSILEVGCGKGQSALVLAECTQAAVTAIDNHQPFLDHLAGRVKALGLENRMQIMNMSMFDMNFPDAEFDLIWSEGSAYFMGFETALKNWKQLLTKDGSIFISDAVWLVDTPAKPCADYFQIEYPGMTTARIRQQQARDLGYEVISDFILPGRDWTDFYDDMEACVALAIEQRGMTRAYENMTREVAIGRAYGDQYGYACLVLRPVS